jgi:hypothetical protein
MTTDTHPSRLGPVVADYVRERGVVWGKRWGEPGPRYPALASAVPDRQVMSAIGWARSRGAVSETVADDHWVLRPSTGRPRVRAV